MKKICIVIFFVFFAYSIHSTVSASGGAGTISDPYTVGSASELGSALNTGSSIAASETLYIKLTANITYGSSDSFKIISNVNVDGNGYAMRYTGTNYTSGTAGYTLTQSGYNVTYTNLTFGSPDYSANQTYYGILLGNSYQTNLTVNNVTYYGKNGAQPFCNYNANTVITMTGTNNFTSIPDGIYDQEFMEGANLVFGENSVTNIVQNTTEGSAVFWNSASNTTFNMTLKKKSKVNISSSKTTFSYAYPMNIVMDESSSLNITSTTYGVTMSSGAVSTVSMARDASFKATGNGKFSSQASGYTTNFNVTDPSSISFENTSSSKGTFASPPKITPSTTTAYALDSYVGTNKTTKDAATTAFSLSDSSFDTNTNKVIYYAKIIPTAFVSSNVTSEPVVSQILFSGLGINSPYTYTSTQYKVYESAQITGDITTSANQSVIENSTSYLYSSTVTDTKSQLSKIKEGSYVIYLKINATSSSGNVASQWISETVTVDSTNLNITVPITMTFLALDNSAFTSDTSYTVVNHSNFDTNFGISAVTGGDSTINLVEDLSTTDKSNPLYLALKNTNGVKMPLIQSGTKTKFAVSAFDGISQFNLIGQYGGALSTMKQQKLNYIMSFNFSK